MAMNSSIANYCSYKFLYNQHKHIIDIKQLKH